MSRNPCAPRLRVGGCPRPCRGAARDVPVWMMAGGKFAELSDEQLLQEWCVPTSRSSLSLSSANCLSLSLTHSRAVSLFSLSLSRIHINTLSLSISLSLLLSLSSTLSLSLSGGERPKTAISRRCLLFLRKNRAF